MVLVVTVVLLVVVVLVIVVVVVVVDVYALVSQIYVNLVELHKYDRRHILPASACQSMIINDSLSALFILGWPFLVKKVIF